MIEYIIGLIALTLGSITDLKTREVPDYLNFSFIGIGFGMATIAAILHADPTYIITSLIGFGACFLFSVAMYYTGQWGGGDAKMLMGIGSVIGISYASLRSLEIPFVLVFLLLTFFIGGIYGLVWLSVIMIKNWEVFKRKYKTVYQNSNKWMRYAMYAIIFVLIIEMVITKVIALKIALGVMSILLIFLYYSYIAIKILEEIGFIQEQPIEKVTEGDWVAEDIKVDEKIIARKKDIGLTKEQLTELQTLAKKGKIKTVKVRYGIPFVPSFLMAFIIAIVVWLR